MRKGILVGVSMMALAGLCLPLSSKRVRDSVYADVVSCVEYPSDADVSANEAFKRGDKRYYVRGHYGYNGGSAEAPGLHGASIDPYQKNLLFLDHVNDPTTGPAKCCDGDYRPTLCAHRWVTWAEQYNRKMCALKQSDTDGCKPAAVKI